MATPIPVPAEGPLGQQIDKDKEVATNTTVDVTHEVYDVSTIDPTLAKKMALVNNAIDEIGMTPWQWKLFFFNGFGYAVDSVSNLRLQKPG
jgi:hypothetical protein